MRASFDSSSVCPPRVVQGFYARLARDVRAPRLPGKGSLVLGMAAPDECPRALAWPHHHPSSASRSGSHRLTGLRGAPPLAASLNRPKAGCLPCALRRPRLLRCVPRGVGRGRRRVHVVGMPPAPPPPSWMDGRGDAAVCPARARRLGVASLQVSSRRVCRADRGLRQAAVSALGHPP